jgi:prepilin-type processing-associated H-X9-DG protein
MIRLSQKHNDRSRMAFTLVELLVVIGIIALLISILLPTLGRARESANSVKCMANLHSMGEALYIYASDYQGSLPIGQIINGSTITAGGVNVVYTGDSTSWEILLAKELNKHAGNGYGDALTSSGSTSKGAYGIFVCPTAPPGASNGTSFTDYSSHPRLIPDMNGADAYANAHAPAHSHTVTTTYSRPYKMTHVKHSTDIMVFFDASVAPNGNFSSVGSASMQATVVGYALDDGAVSSPQGMTDDYSVATNKTIGSATPISLEAGGNGGTGGVSYNVNFLNQDMPGNYGNIRFRHMNNKQANALMLDGHVQAFHINTNIAQIDALQRFSDLTEGNINVDP